MYIWWHILWVLYSPGLNIDIKYYSYITNITFIIIVRNKLNEILKRIRRMCKSLISFLKNLQKHSSNKE